jgi:hypothetical protein
LVLGSLAEYVVRHSEIPVLLVTARSAATGAFDEDQLSQSGIFSQEQ